MRRITPVILSALCGLMLLTPARAELTDPAMLMPADVTIFVTVDIPALKTQFQRTLWGRLPDATAMQPFVRSAREGIEEAMRKFREEFTAETGIEAPEEIPWPLGRAAMAMRVTQKEVTRTWGGYYGPTTQGMYGPGGEFGSADDLQYDAPSSDENVHTYTTTVPVVAGVAVVDFGANLDPLRELERRIVAAAVDDGAVQRTGQTYRGAEITVLTTEDANESLGNQFAYAYSGTLLVVGNDLDMVRHVLGRLDGAPAPSLGEQAPYRGMVHALGEAQVVGFLDVQRLIGDLTEQARAEDGSEVNKILRATGADGLRCAGWAVEVAPSPVIQWRSRARLTVDGPKRGVVALMAPQTRPIRLPAIATTPLKTIFVANLEPAEIFDQVNMIGTAVGGAPLGVAVQGALAATGGGGRPPVSLRNDTPARLHGPIAMRLTTAEHEPDAPPQDNFLVSIAADDTTALNEAIGRIHGTFMNMPDVRRELLGSTLYLFDPQDDDVPGLTLAGDALLIGSVSELEAAIMSLRGDEQRTLATDAMFRHARRFLPGEAGAWGYTDQREGIGPIWDAVRRAAAQEAEDDDDEYTYEPFNPWVSMVEEFEDYVDFALLPDFEQVKRYFGAETFHLVATDDGFAAESVIVAPPAEPQ